MATDEYRSDQKSSRSAGHRDWHEGCQYVLEKITGQILAQAREEAKKMEHQAAEEAEKRKSR